jgi:hypothetical protein
MRDILCLLKRQLGSDCDHVIRILGIGSINVRGYKSATCATMTCSMATWLRACSTITAKISTTTNARAQESLIKCVNTDHAF